MKVGILAQPSHLPFPKLRATCWPRGHEASPGASFPPFAESSLLDLIDCLTEIASDADSLFRGILPQFQRLSDRFKMALRDFLRSPIV